jgi:uncharacterized membrane protein HdeD (DUF308 family)
MRTASSKRARGWFVAGMLTVSAGVAAASSSAPLEMFLKTWLAGALFCAAVLPIVHVITSRSRQRRDRDDPGPPG